MLTPLLVAGSVGLSIAQPPAEQKSAPPLVIQVGVGLIQIDASVTDRDGRPVTDLRTEEFTLEVGGEKRAITNAAFFGRAPGSSQPGLTTPAGAPVEPGPRVIEGPSTVIFLVDDLNMSAGSMDAAKQALSGFVRDWPQFHTRAALRATSDSSMAFSLYASPERFAVALQGLKYTARSLQGGSSARAVQSDTNVSSRLSMREEEDLITRSPYALELFHQRVTSLTSTINTLRAVPGRKALVFISEGLTLGARGRDRVNIDAPLLSLFDDSDVDGALRSVAEVANRASVVLYTVDPRGLAVHEASAQDGASISQASSLAAARRFAHLENQRTLQQIAADTGGVSIVNTNDLHAGLTGALRDQAAYYLIGFEPPDKAFERAGGRPKFHKVRLTVSRPGVKVRTRAGFFGVTDEEMTKKRR